ncbi:ABC transporter substrate-binding protein [Candidatus Fermentibacteria bacterium]|nr:ABC transporter substrate-binding protein [Candidatus Fermentibacteria bacterium]
MTGCKGQRWICMVMGAGLTGALAAWVAGVGLSSLDGPGATGRAPVAEGGGAQARFSRVITFTPALTEIVCAIGAGETLVGRGSFVTFPPEVFHLPVVGGIVDPNLEVIRALRPDLVLAQGDVPHLRDLCDRMGAHLAVLEIETIEEIYRAIEEVGWLLKRRASARVLTHRIGLDLALIEEEACRRSPRPVFICVGRQLGGTSRLWTVGPGSFLHELVTLAGGDNVFGDLPTSYHEVSAEEVVRRAPRAILDIMPRGVGSVSGGVSVWEHLFGTPGPVVVVITGDYVLYPGPRISLVARQVVDALAGDE